MTVISTSDKNAVEKLRIAVVGAGHWGLNLARNFQTSAEWDLVALCDRNIERAYEVAEMLDDVPVVESLDELLDTHDVDAVAIATPARNHFGTVMTAIAAGKHVLVEEPIAHSWAHGWDMVVEAESRGLVLMADHAYCYTPAIQTMRELLQDGSLGELLYVDSVTSNVRPDRPDVDVFWDLAPQELAILDFVLPEGLNPEDVSAFGADPLGTGRDCLGHLNLRLANDATAHIQMNWLSPTKARKLVIAGSLRTLIWDDAGPNAGLTVSDSRIALDRGGAPAREAGIPARKLSLADVRSPAFPGRDSLSRLLGELASCIRNKRDTATCGGAGLRVLSVLEAAARSLGLDGQAAAVEAHELQMSGLTSTGERMERAG